jgi:hypothetical protein
MDLRPVSVKGNRTMKIVGKQSLVTAVMQPSPGQDLASLHVAAETSGHT